MIKHLILIPLVLLLFTGCSEKKDVTQRTEFFAWMDAYLAVEKNVENAVAVTLFFEDAPYAPSDISNISFIGVSDQVVITDFQITSTKLPDWKYSSYGITLNYTAKTTGKFQTSGIIVTLKSNKTIHYPIGNWEFDVGEPDAGKLNTWNSPVASANGTQFSYQYSLENTIGIVKRIYYGQQLYIENDQGVSLEGVIDLNGHYFSPIVFIKSKIVLSEDGKEFINYGKGSYCGAMNFSEEVLEKSKTKNAID